MASAIALVGEALTWVLSSEAAFRVGNALALRAVAFLLVRLALFFVLTVFTDRDAVFFVAVFLVAFLDDVFTVF